MGRKIRRVPPGWEHPKDSKGNYIPMYDKDYETKAAEWLENCLKWAKGEHKDQSPDFKYYWEWDGKPPDPESYRPRFIVEPTWYQVYETVSEGTPVTPPFATKEELAIYLSTHGDFGYQQGYRDISPKPTYENAMKFIEQGFVPSGMMSGGIFKSTYDTVKP